jgi:hypothetical protein
MDAPSPGRGEVRHTPLPNTWDGIRFEIGRMCRLVSEGRKEKIVIDAAREAVARYSTLVEEYAHDRGEEIEVHGNKVLQAEACDILCRHLFFYVNDPAQVEVIQTPERMIRHARLPIDVLRKFMEPFYAALEELEPDFHRGSYSPKALFIGDCDEQVVVYLSMLASLSIGFGSKDDKLCFAFGGDDGAIHHTWARAYIAGEPWNSDFTEPGLRFGQQMEFEDYDELEVPL